MAWLGQGRPGQNGIFVLKSTGGFKIRAVSPCSLIRCGPCVSRRSMRLMKDGGCQSKVPLRHGRTDGRTAPLAVKFHATTIEDDLTRCIFPLLSHLCLSNHSRLHSLCSSTWQACRNRGAALLTGSLVQENCGVFRARSLPCPHSCGGFLLFSCNKIGAGKFGAALRVTR